MSLTDSSRKIQTFETAGELLIQCMHALHRASTIAALRMQMFRVEPTDAIAATSMISKAADDRRP